MDTKNRRITNNMSPSGKMYVKKKVIFNTSINKRVENENKTFFF
jgi:hypothetical protein